MRTILIIFMLILLSVLVWFGIETAAKETHQILGNASYQPFYQEIFK